MSAQLSAVPIRLLHCHLYSCEITDGIGSIARTPPHILHCIYAELPK